MASVEQVFVDLMTTQQTSDGITNPLSYMSTYNVFDASSLLGKMFTGISMAIAKGLSAILNAFEGFASNCYKFLSFSESDAMSDLYDILTDYIWIPLLICAVIVCFKLVSGDINKQSGKQFLKNFGVFIFVIAFLPSIFSFMNNNVITGDYLSDISGEMTAADSILRTHVVDMEYIVAKTYNDNADFKKLCDCLKDGNLTENIAINTDDLIKSMKSSQDTYANSNFALNLCSFNNNSWNYNAAVGDDESGDESSDKKYGIFQYGIMTQDGSQLVDNVSNDNLGSTAMSTEQMNQVQSFVISKDKLYRFYPLPTGFFDTWIGKEYYNRYYIDWLQIWLQLIATAVMYFCIGYSVIKLSWELIIHQTFAPVMAAMDLAGGQRIKKYLSAIVGCYAGLLISAMIIKIYSALPAFIHSTNGMNIQIGDLTESIILIICAIIFLDGPNIISQYFGTKTGVRGGMMLAGAAAAMAGRAIHKTASSSTGALIGGFEGYRNGGGFRYAFAGAASGAYKGAGRTASDIYDNNRRNALQAQRDKSNRMERANQQDERNRQMAQAVDDRNDRMKAGYEQKAESYQASHGSDGNFEQYMEPQDYNAMSLADSNGMDNKAAAEQVAMQEMMQEDRMNKHSTADGKPPLDVADVENVNGNTARNTAIKDADGRINSIKATGVSDNDKKAMLDNYRNAVNSLSEGSVRDAKYGLKKGIAAEAERNGGDKKAYTNAADSFISKTGKDMDTSYLADSAYVAEHHAALRENAKSIQALSKNGGGRGYSDAESLAEAMRQDSKYGFNEKNINSIAVNEIRDNGSLRAGHTYDNRPIEPIYESNPYKHKRASKALR